MAKRSAALVRAEKALAGARKRATDLRKKMKTNQPMEIAGTVAGAGGGAGGTGGGGTGGGGAGGDDALRRAAAWRHARGGDGDSRPDTRRRRGVPRHRSDRRRHRHERKLTRQLLSFG